MWDGWIDVAAASFLEILFALCGGGGRLVRYGRGEFPFTITVSGGGGGGSCGDRCEIGVINDARSHASRGGSGNLNSVTHPATSSGIPGDYAANAASRSAPCGSFASHFHSRWRGRGGPTNDRGDKFG